MQPGSEEQRAHRLRLEVIHKKSLEEHSDSVRALAMSPDGRFVVSGSEDKTLIVWDTATKQPVGQPLTGHTGWVRCLAMSPDGRFVVSGSEDKTLIVWDRETARLEAARSGVEEAAQHRLLETEGQARDLEQGHAKLMDSVARSMELCERASYREARRLKDLRHLEEYFLRMSSSYPELSKLAAARDLFHQLRRMAYRSEQADLSGRACSEQYAEEASRQCHRIAADSLWEDASLLDETSPVQVPLSNVRDLLAHLESQLHNNKAFSDAIKGPKLRDMLQDLLDTFPDGTTAFEHQELSRQMSRYVEDMWAELHKEKSSAAVLMDRFKQDEEGLVSDIRAKSQELSKPEYQVDRCEREGARTSEAVQLMDKFEEKLDAVCGRDSLTALLTSSFNQFEAEHAESQRFREQKQQENEGLARAAIERKSRIEELLPLRLEELTAARAEARTSAQSTESTLEECTAAILDAFAKIKSAVDSDLAARAKLSHAEAQAEAFRGEAERTCERLAASIDMHSRLAERFGHSHQLQHKFAEWLQAAYEGMECKTKQTMVDLHANLPDDISKHSQLADAVGSALQQQCGRLRSAQLTTLQRVQQQEAELQRFEYSGVAREVFAQKQAEFERDTESLNWQRDMMESLNSEIRKLQDNSIRFNEKVKRINPTLALLDEAGSLEPKIAGVPDDWAARFFFTDPPPQPSAFRMWHQQARSPLGNIGTYEISPAPSEPAEEMTDGGFIVLRGSAASGGASSGVFPSAQSAPAAPIFKSCLLSDSVLLDGKGDRVPLAELEAGAPLLGGARLRSKTEVLPEQCHDLVTLKTAHGVTFCMATDHPLPARPAGNAEFAAAVASSIGWDMEVLTTDGPAKVKGFGKATEMTTVTRIALEPHGAHAFLCGQNEASIALAVHGEAESSVLLRIDRHKGLIDAVTDTMSAGAPSHLSEPLPASSSARRVAYQEPVDLETVRGEDLSVGSRGHPNCSGVCQHVGRCKFGLACKRCHVPSCTRRLSKKERESRASGSSP